MDATCRSRTTTTYVFQRFRRLLKCIIECRMSAGEEHRTRLPCLGEWSHGEDLVRTKWRDGGNGKGHDRDRFAESAKDLQHAPALAVGRMVDELHERGHVAGAKSVLGHSGVDGDAVVKLHVCPDCCAFCGFSVTKYIRLSTARLIQIRCTRTEATGPTRLPSTR